MSSSEQNPNPECNPADEKKVLQDNALTRKGKPTTGRGRKVAILGLLAASLALAIYALRDSLRAVWRPVAGVSSPQDPHAARSPEHRPDGEKRILYWQDPMHPEYKSDKPGKAPDCGMDLVPVYAGDAPAPESPEGAFKITSEKQQLIGIKYGEVRLQRLSKTIRAVARLAYDETRIWHVHSKIEGWIERVYVDFTGKLVQENQPLLSIYSPELLATQEEYLLALKARNQLGRSSISEVAAGVSSLLEAARQRLELWDVSSEQIEELERTRKIVKAIPFHSPHSGFVTARNAYEKQRVTPETELYTIADLSTIWVIADIYEFEAPEIRLGQSATMTLPYFPGRTFRGKITYIYPQLDDATRTLKVRAEFANPDFALKPDMYANVELRIEYGTLLAVPQEAVLDSGSVKLVFVSLDGGYFEPRKVQLGAKVDNLFVVLDGLKRGERVVTSGNFLIDSESKLKAAATGFGMPGMEHGSAAASGQAQSLPLEPSGTKGHSKHQTTGQSSTAPPQPGDHSQHEQKKGMNRHD